MNDRRRINGPVGGTNPTVFSADLASQLLPKFQHHHAPQRKLQETRKIFLRTGLTPSASGSAYLELEKPRGSKEISMILSTSTLKLSCSVYGPRPLPRSASFTPQMQITTHIKFAPFAAKHRRGYLRDITERDLSAHVENALRGVIVTERWPKSSLEIVITVLEADEILKWDAGLKGDLERDPGNNVDSMMSILSGCITVASTAIIHAGIDCVDVVSGGVAALVRSVSDTDQHHKPQLILDPSPRQHQDFLAICTVGYLKARDETTEVWMLGSEDAEQCDQLAIEHLIDGAIQAAAASALVIQEAVKPESA